MKQNKKIQVLNVVIANGTAAGKQDFRVTLDSEFDFCEGYYAIVNSNGGLTRYNLGLKTDQKTIQDLAHKSHMEASTSYKISDRFNRDTPFESKGKIVIVTVETFAATTSELNLDVLFDLAKKTNC